MMDHVRASFTEADVVALIVDATEPFGQGRRVRHRDAARSRRKSAETKRFAILNKIDLLKKNKLLPLIEQYTRLGLFDEIVPVSAVDRRRRRAARRLALREPSPTGEPLYPDRGLHHAAGALLRRRDRPREAAAAHRRTSCRTRRPCRSIAWKKRRRRTSSRSTRPSSSSARSQKPIVIGKRGDMIKRIGTEARVELESILGAQVFLDLHVAVHERWREDERFLGELDWPLTE